MTRGWIVALLALLPVAAAAQQAAPAPGRLERAGAIGQFVIGHRESAVPFAYFGDEQQPMGYAVDVARQVFEAVKASLGKPKLRLRFNAVTPTTRLPLMETRVIDIECGVTDNTVERQKQLAVSNTYYVDAVRIAVRSDSPVSAFGDLAGRRVAVVRSTRIEAQVQRLAAEQKLEITLVTVRSDSSGVQALEDGRVDAFVAGTATLLGQFSLTANPARFKVVGDGLLDLPYACVLPKGDPAYKQLVDATLADMMRSGQMAKLHAKWFEAPIPPYRRTLNLRLNDATRASFASPNDRPLQ
ncbi:MAG TPA: amino acid ABC transporter substrate-binding protein [Burkholderiales bacterium]|nr:amino acid ABC transporter substrate-binding protein [Burkholderiales bacterium]